MLKYKRYFYHNTGGKPPRGTQIVFQQFRGFHTVECLNGLELKPQRGVNSKAKNDIGNNIYDVTGRVVAILQ